MKINILLLKAIRRSGPLLAVLALLQAISLADTVIDVTASPFNAVPDSGNDATMAFQQAIAAARAVGGPVTLQVPGGRYDFFANHATRRICYCSNATESSSDGTRTIAIDLTDINDLTISGPGAKLVVRGKMTILVAERCENLTLSGLEFDFDRPTFSEITAVEKQGGYWIGEVHADSDYRITGGKRVQWFGEDWQDYHNMVQHFDHGTGKVWRGRDPTAGASAVTDLGNRRLRFDGGSLDKVVEGRTYQFRNTHRDEVGMWINRCRNVVMEDVTVRAMHGFGIDTQFTEDATFRRLTVAPSSDGGRTNASAADILHFSGCKGTIRILDSTLSAAHDDALNVHGTHLQIVGQPARNKLRLRFMHHQSWGFQAFIPGDEIELVSKDTLLSYETAKVTAVTGASDPKEQTITLNKNISVSALNSDVVENVTWTPAVEMINCDIRNIPTRGILLTTRRPVLIQGNRFFRTSMHGILIANDARGWYESGPVHDLTIRGNSFFECAESVIQINPHYNSHSGPVHRNIRVEENVFTLAGNGAASAKAVNGLSFRNNRFRMRNGSTPKASALVGTENTTGLSFSGNLVESASAPAFAIQNGDFEETDPAPGAEPAAVAGWFSANESGNRTVNPGSRMLELDPGAAVYQDLGPYDPALGSDLRITLDFVEVMPAASPLQVSLLKWDGRFEAADGADAGPQETLLNQNFETPGAGLHLSLDLSGLAAGTRLWLRLAGPKGKVRVDNVSLAQTSPH